MRRIWTVGEANVSSADPPWDLAQHLWAQAPSLEVSLQPWQVSFTRGRPTARTIGRWCDERAGTITAAIALRKGEVSACDWGVIAEAEHGWSAHATPPWVRLGFDGEGFCDPSGAALSSEPVILPIEAETEYPDAVAAMVSGFGDPQRSTGVLAVVLSGRKTYAALGNLALANWPGLIGIAYLSEEGRRVFNRLLPERPVPDGGTRFLAAACDGLDDVPFSRSALRNRPGAFTTLLSRAMQARAACPPRGLAAEAAGLLQTALTPAPSVADTQVRVLGERITALEDDLAAARHRAAHAEAAAERAQQETAAAHAQLAALRAAPPQPDGGDRTGHDLRERLAALTSERDLLEELVEQAEAERDSALRQRARLAARVGTAEAWQAHPEEPVAASFAELIAEARTRHRLLVLDFLDEAPAVALDEHPKAASWRRKTADALATLAAYAQAKEQAKGNGRAAGPHLADPLAFIRSGAPGAAISANIVSLTESEQVLNDDRYRSARTFPVRTQTDRTGKALFAAHIRLERFKAPAPRLHFLDDTDGTGVVYIGWIGPHLASSRTN